jgi:uncharacterized membrane protein
MAAKNEFARTQALLDALREETASMTTELQLLTERQDELQQEKAGVQAEMTKCTGKPGSCRNAKLS